MDVQQSWICPWESNLQREESAVFPNEVTSPGNLIWALVVRLSPVATVADHFCLSDMMSSHRPYDFHAMTYWLLMLQVIFSFDIMYTLFRSLTVGRLHSFWNKWDTRRNNRQDVKIIFYRLRFIVRLCITFLSSHTCSTSHSSASNIINYFKTLLQNTYFSLRLTYESCDSLYLGASYFPTSLHIS